MKYESEDFFNAVINADVAKVEEMLETEPELVNAADSQGATALFYNITAEMMSLLCSLDMDVNARDQNGGTALHLHAGTGCLEKVELLISQGADVNAVDSMGRTPLQEAFEDSDEDSSEIADLLIEYGACIRHIDEAIAVGDTTWLKSHFKENPGKINTSDSFGCTPLEWAIEYGRQEVIDLLMGLDIDIDCENTYGRTALHEFSADGNINAISFLLSYGADINVKSSRDSMTPLMCAAQNGRISAVKFLLSRGADVNLKNNDGKSAMQLAITASKRKARWPNENNSIHIKRVKNCRSIASILRSRGKKKWLWF
jgi:ankyrin repeat protein